MSTGSLKNAPGEPMSPAPTKQDPKLDPEHLQNDHPQDRFGQPRQSKAVREALARGAPNIDLASLPDLSNMTAENITESVIAVNSMCDNPRMKFIFEHLVRHLHDFAREVSLTTQEWETAIQFLTKVGQISTPVRHEFILLSDVLGLSSLVDSMNHPIPQGSKATESSVLGPFFAEEAPEVLLGESIASDGKGEYMYISGQVLDTQGKGIADCVLDTWEGDESGFYDLQYEDGKSDCRGRLKTDKEGKYRYRLVRPTNYPVPNDGPIGKLCDTLGRHVFRPAHLHMQLQADGYERLTTALYMAGDEYLHSDAVFGAKSSLVCHLKPNYDEAQAKELGFSRGPFWETTWDFVLQTIEEAEQSKRQSLPNYYKFLDASTTLHQQQQ